MNAGGNRAINVGAPEAARRGFIKLEDTVIVQPDGFEVYGDRIRGWNRAGRGA